MIHNPEHLAAYVRDTLKDQERCRVFAHVLGACWEMPPAEQAQTIAAFAKEHGWQVMIHAPAKFGIVADFRKPSAGSAPLSRFKNGSAVYPVNGNAR